MPIPASILERVATFSRNLESYLHPDYKETQLRREFLDPLFDALGWDVANRAGYAEAYKDVVHEDSLKISGVGATAPDYSFRIGGTRKFLVEAKKPSVKIKDDPAPAAQLRRYSYSAKLPLGIVTDFQEFAIYDTRQRPGTSPTRPPLRYTMRAIRSRSQPGARSCVGGRRLDRPARFVPPARGDSAPRRRL